MPPCGPSSTWPFLGVAPQTVRSGNKWRAQLRQVGGKLVVRFRPGEIQSWVAERDLRVTAEEEPPLLAELRRRLAR